MLESYSFHSINEGFNLLITGAVHGDEICGKIAAKRIIAKLQNGEIILKKGSITLIPASNPVGNFLDKRYYETNLNRCIKKTKEPKLYEEKIANILTKYIEDADYHLDLHSMDNNGIPFAFEDYAEAADFAKCFGLKWIFRGWPNVYKDSTTIQDLSTQAFSHKSNTISVTIEAGSHKDFDAIDLAEKCILNAMNFCGFIDYKPKNEYDKSEIIDMKKVFFKEKEGKLSKVWGEMEFVKKGVVIAEYQDGEKIIADDDYYMIFPSNNDDKIGEEWFYLGQNI
ncbi:MAG: hypothetical protein Ta2D_04320 [Rickettsiales bacterium]|nr:MAG: hypothetical protein Ta2D_04320 [Rickettsiales bacterium]